MAICLIIPVLATLALIIYGCVVGGRAWQAAHQVQGEPAQVLRYLALNLCEPVVGTPLVLMTLALLGGWPDAIHFPLNMLICWPMVVLLIPAFGRQMRDARYQHIVERATHLGAARIVCNMLCFALIRATESPNAWSLLATALVMLLPLASLGVLWHTIQWSRQTISTIAPTYPLPSGQQPALNTARPTHARPAALPASGLQSMEQMAPCPECAILIPHDAAICPHCGLVFTSHLPAELHDLPRFTILRPLREGGMSQTYLARDRAIGNCCVIKVANASDARQCLEREALLLRDLRHSGVVPFVGWYPDAALPFAALAYLPGLSLDQMLTLGPISLDRALHYTRVVAETLCYLASRPAIIVHCDLKPGNLIVNPTTDSVVLVDFGSAIEMRSNQPMAAAPGLHHYSTPGYAPPELYRGQPTPRSDVYGLAATLYHLATGDDPSNHPLTFPALNALPGDISAALRQALAHDPAQRPTPFIFRDTLRHLSGRSQFVRQSSAVIAQRS